MTKSKSKVPKYKYETIQVLSPEGTRAFLRKAAELSEVELNVWIREVLHREATRVLAEHKAAYDRPAVHPVRPPPLLPSRR